MSKKKSNNQQSSSPTSNPSTYTSRTTRPSRAGEHTLAQKRDITVPPPAAVSIAPVGASTEGPSADEIARLAYSYWQARGGQGGSPEQDWLRAEQELVAKLRGDTTAAASA